MQHTVFCELCQERLLSFKCLTKEQLDMLLLSQLIAHTDTDTCKNRNKSGERQKLYTSHFHCGQAICRKMFMFIHGVSKKRLYNIASSFHKHGIAPRVHGKTKHLPVNTLSLQSVEHVVRFLLNYVEKHGLLLPGRIPGYSRSDIKLLPSSTSKRSIWKLYFESTQEEPSLHAVAYSTFCKLWQFQLRQIKLMKPITDLCWTCQQNSSALLKCANSPEKQKSETVLNALEHLRIVQCERSYYKTTCDKLQTWCRELLHRVQHFSASSTCISHTRSIKVHYSFDYAQQIHYPSDPMQPGPIYFMTPRKCSIFGVNCEALPRHLTDEAGDCGKGANTVISQLDFFFTQHGLGEKEVFLHADNCCGQNKNNCMLWYLAWRAITGRHTDITLSFLVVGHTKFSPDWCFGLLK